ncbi:hypothetical protein [Oceanicella actignis]|uniref:Phage tail tape measure protein, lambda family n=1 Tax=Oceanicella actignis TaxID=1189325 RepID=A0A1M7U1Q5_9RHOB|nr:hypothetical protein [Oceanicella actignis]SES76765.1 hypothetical protein SAMN04488119_101403 [Oceanicella actignis]SHN76906.1 hypothetical protein SAMN05216200_11419 [Oceanicella actignis]
MALKDLFFNILAKDKTGAAFKSVRDNLAGVDGAARTASERIASVGRGMAKVGAAASAASASILFAFRDSLSLYDTQARAEAKVARAVESTAGAAGFAAAQLYEMAGSLQAVTRFGDEEILSKVTGQLLTFTNVAGDEFRRAQVVALDLATVLEGDLQSAAIMLGKALNDPVKGLSAMSEAGVTFNATQQETIKTLAAAGKVAEAQRVILEELERQYGGQAEAAARAGLGALQQLANTWGDIKEEVGGIIAEILPPVISALRALADGFQAMPEPAKRFAVAIGALAVALGPVLGVVGLLVAGMAALSGPVLAAAAGVGALTAAAAAFWPEIESAIGWVRAAWGEMTLLEKAMAPVSLAVRAVADTFAALFPETAALVSETVDRIVAIFRGKLAAAFDWVKGAVASVSDAFFQMYDAVVGHSYVPDMVDGIAEEFARLDGAMVKVSDDAAGAVGAAFDGLADDVAGALTDMARDGEFSFRRFAGVIMDSANAMVDSLVRDVFGRLNGEAGAALTRAISGAGAAAPSGGVFGAIGGFLADGLAAVLPSFNNGADFVAAGAGGIDRNVAAFNVSRGERITVTPRGAAAGAAPVVNVTIQTPSPAAFSASRNQVAAQIARAVGRGQRMM